MIKKLLILCIFSIFSISTSNADYTVLYDNVPDINSCTEGKLKSTETLKILEYVNKVRALHKLPPVVYNSAHDAASQKTSLIMASNETLNHFPPTSYTCYSALGKEGAAASNLYISWVYGSAVESSEKSVGSWMNDGGVNECGHRRWIINPWVVDISYGRVDGKSKQNSSFNVTATNLYYSSNATKNLSSLENDFVAYPYQEYPKELIYDYENKYWKFSFTALQDKNNMWNNQSVNYGSATISIKDESNAVLNVGNITTNNQGYGVPNALMWEVTGLQNNKKYNVTISNVITSGGTKSYSYWFKITDGWPTSNSLAAPTLTTPANKATNIGNPIALKWNAVTTATSYEVYFDNSPYTDGNLLVSKKGITGTSFVIDSNLLEPNTTYYWGVRAYDNNGNISNWSTEYTLTTKQPSAPQAPLSYLPKDGSTNIPVKAQFVWSKVKSIVLKEIENPLANISYQLQISKKSDFSDIILDLDLNDTTYTADDGDLPFNSKIYWKVRALNYSVPGNWSSIMSFNTLDPSDVNEIITQSDFYNYPNPFENSTQIVFDSRFNTIVEIEIFDLLGNQITKVYNGELKIGLNRFEIELPIGIYYCRIKGDKINQTIKLISKK